MALESTLRHAVIECALDGCVDTGLLCEAFIQRYVGDYNPKAVESMTVHEQSFIWPRIPARTKLLLAVAGRQDIAALLSGSVGLYTLQVSPFWAARGVATFTVSVTQLGVDKGFRKVRVINCLIGDQHGY